MNKRILSIDVLRGLTIFLMVLSASLVWNANLPAYMFHCQVGPPSFAFNPDIKGITWVDLVFPWFIFTMGASMPFSLGRKLEKGVPVWKVSLGVVKRWLTLAAFGLVLGNADLIGGNVALPQIAVRIGIWLALFVALVRVKDGARIKGWAVNLAGLVMLAVMLLVEKFAFDVQFSFGQNNVIIMILSALALLGGFIWLLTRRSMIARFIILLAVCAVKEVDWQWHCLGMLELPGAISWLFNWGYAQYLVITIVGMSAGDLLKKANSDNAALCANAGNWKTVTGAILCALLTPAMLWALYTRHIWAALDITALSAMCFVLLLTREDRTVWTQIARMGFALLALGIVFDPIDGGITKDYCNLSYMLTTSGLACLMTAFLLWGETLSEQRGRQMCKGLAMTGQNPMIAYTISGFIILPLINLIMSIIPGGSEWLTNLTAGRPLAGLLYGIFLTCLMMLATNFFTAKKLFWRS